MYKIPTARRAALVKRSPLLGGAPHSLGTAGLDNIIYNMKDNMNDKL